MPNKSFRRVCAKKFGLGRVRILGHCNVDETVSLAHERQICMLVDLIDNIGEYRAGRSWSSTIAIYHPVTRQIAASFVACPTHLPARLYYATHDGGSFRMKFTNLYAPNLPVAIHTTDCTSLNAAKLVAFLSDHCLPCQLFLMAAESGRLQSVAPPNVAGSLGASLASLADGDIDGVLNFQERLFYTVIPGMIIAFQAGASLANGSSVQIDRQQLELQLIMPGTLDCRYIAVSSKELIPQLASLLALSLIHI